MKHNDTLSRITFEIPAETHKRLKAVAALSGKSMRAIIINSIEKELDLLGSQSVENCFPRTI